MLTLPSVLQVGDITVFPDDEDPALFHYLPSKIELALDPAGRPQFEFVFYDVGEDEEAPDSLTGGYILFTVKLVSDKSVLDGEIMDKLRPIVRRAFDNPVDVPQPKLTQVDFIDGHATLFIAALEGREGSRIQLGKPSLMGGNTLTVMAQMDAHAAAMLAEVLSQGKNVAAIEYDLILEARLPGVMVTAKIEASRVRGVISTWSTQELESTRDTTWGKKTDTQEVRKRTSFSETLEEHSLVELDIRAGSSNVAIDDELKQNLTDFAMGAMDKFIASEWLNVGGVLDQEALQDVNLEDVTEDFSRDFNMSLTSRDVITRPYSPSASISTSFLGGPLDDFVTRVNLGSPFFDRLRVPVSTSFDFEKYGDFVHAVVVHISYSGTDETGQKHENAESYVITKDNLNDTTNRTFLTKLGTDDKYDYKIEVIYKGGPVERREVDSGTSRDRALIASVENPGLIDIEFACPPEVFSGEIGSVEITAEYADRRNRVEKFQESFILTREKPTAKLFKPIYAEPTEELIYNVVYVFADGTQRVEAGPIRIPASKSHERIPAPFDGIFNLQIQPMVDWEDVQAIIVGLNYTDTPNDYRKSFLLNFSEEAKEGQTITFNLLDETHTEAELTETIITKRDGIIQKPVRTVDPQTSPAVAIGNATGGLVKMTVDAFEVDLGGAVKRVIINLNYADEDNDVFDSKSMIFKTVDDMHDWEVGLTDKSKRDFTYDIRYIMTDGPPVRLDDVPGTLDGSIVNLSIPDVALPEPEPDPVV